MLQDRVGMEKGVPLVWFKVRLRRAERVYCGRVVFVTNADGCAFGCFAVNAMRPSLKAFGVHLANWSPAFWQHVFKLPVQVEIFARKQLAVLAFSLWCWCWWHLDSRFKAVCWLQVFPRIPQLAVAMQQQGSWRVVFVFVFRVQCAR